MSKESLWEKFDAYVINEGVSKLRRRKLLMMYRIITRHLNLEKANRESIEKFVDNLNHNKCLKLKGTPFSGNTKSDMKKFLKQFFKWYKGKGEYYPEEVAWLKTRIPKDEKPKERPIIELKDAMKLATRFKKLDNQMMTLILFDSGFRISEAMSAKKRDLTWEEFDRGNKCFWIKCNVSKTFPRKIPIPLFTENISAYFNSADYIAKRDDEPLFDISYRAYLNLLNKYGMELFGVTLTPHCLRHSSATYYAREYSGNVPLLAQRYGWSFDASELKVYVRQSGAYNKEGAKISYRNEIGSLKEDLDNFKDENSKMKEQLEEMNRKFAMLGKFEEFMRLHNKVNGKV